MKTNHLAEPELAAIKFEGGLTRSSFLVRGTLAAGAAYGLSAVGPYVSRSFAAGGGDIDIVNYALTLEYLEAAFYQQAYKKVPGLSGDLKKLVKEIGDNEQEHVDALKATAKKLGGTPAKKPGVDFANAFADKATFLKVANVFEDTGVSAYNGAAPMIQAAAVLGAAGAIAQVEARHAALIRLQRGKPPAPQAFDKASDMATVLKAVQPFIKS
jgi:rubrerythrin